jgi:hypothetical protein
MVVSAFELALAFAARLRDAARVVLRAVESVLLVESLWLAADVGVELLLWPLAGAVKTASPPKATATAVKGMILMRLSSC